MTKNLIIKIAVLSAVISVGSFIVVNFALADNCPANTTVSETSANLVGEITDDGGDPNLEVWFDYGKTTSYGSQTSHQSKYGLGLFCTTISGLESCATYRYRAVAKNSAGTSYGGDYSFTTKCAPVSVDIKANGSDGSITISYNSSASLSWTSANANSCSASGNWSGSKSTSGSESTSNLTSSKTYTITCTGSGGSASDSVTINVSSPVPTVDLKANSSNGPITLNYRDYVSLSWTSQNTASCDASGDWSGSKAVSSSESMQLNSVKTYTFTIICRNTDGSQTATDSVQVTSRAKLPGVITKPAVVTY